VYLGGAQRHFKAFLFKSLIFSMWVGDFFWNPARLFKRKLRLWSEEKVSRCWIEERYMQGGLFRGNECAGQVFCIRLKTAHRDCFARSYGCPQWHTGAGPGGSKTWAL